jgi:uncharacterized Zn finger protein
VPFDLSESRIRDHASSESFARGEDYYRQGAVISLTLRGGVLWAEVAGSEFAPYGVRVSFDEAGVTEAACECLYEWGGWCKHIVAALLARIREPELVRELPALEEVLSGLDKDQLGEILLKLAGRDPSLVGVIESELSLSSSSDTRPVNAEAIRRRLRSSIHEVGYRRYDGYWESGGDLAEARRVLDGAWNFIQSDDGRKALPVLEAITEEYMESWEMSDWEAMGDYGGELLDFFREVGVALTEAMLSVDLTSSEREDWSAKLDVWWGVLGDYDTGDTFSAAFRAVEQGWSYPPLVRVLEGEIPDDEFFEALLDDPLTAARLSVLERRGCHEEYLRLSEAAEEATGHAIMLARLGRVQDAVVYSLERLVAPEEILAVAEVLREQAGPQAALRVGEYGLSLEGRKGRLATWVRDLAEGVGRLDLALRASVTAFRADPGLASYRRVRELSGEGWPERREELFDHLRQSMPYYPRGNVEVFLHEGLIQDAIDAVEKSPIETLLEQVADAAVDSHPNWVIETCRAKAEEIMTSGNSKHYEEAVVWLARARDAYLADGREEVWRAYLDELIGLHQRKYKLRPMLENLGRQ